MGPVALHDPGALRVAKAVHGRHSDDAKRPRATFLPRRDDFGLEAGFAELRLRLRGHDQIVARAWVRLGPEYGRAFGERGGDRDRIGVIGMQVRHQGRCGSARSQRSDKLVARDEPEGVLQAVDEQGVTVMVDLDPGPSKMS